jgi:hypothetical protein
MPEEPKDLRPLVEVRLFRSGRSFGAGSGGREMDRLPAMRAEDSTVEMFLIHSWFSIQQVGSSHIRSEAPSNYTSLR